MSDHPASSSDDRSLDLQQAQHRLSDLYNRVATHHHRVEIVDGVSGEPCVIIAKCDLDSLEKALEILSEVEPMRQVCQSIADVIARCPDAPPIEQQPA